MKRKFIFVVLASCFLLSLCGFAFKSQGNLLKAEFEKQTSINTSQDKVTEGKSVAQSVTRLNVEFDSVDDMGNYYYTDSQYKYRVDINNNCITRIDMTPQYSRNRPSVINTIDTNKAEEIASTYFNQAVGNIVEGKLEHETLDKAENGYIIDIVEKINDLETGTRGMVMLASDGSLLGAVFHVGSPDMIRTLDKSTLITEFSAKETALSVVKQNEESIKESDIAAELHTFKGIIYWYVTIPTLQTDDFETYIKNYYIEINALTGEVIDEYQDLV